MNANDWNAHLYDEKLGFVSEMGKALIDLLAPQKGEKILDLGCGTGDLAYQIARSGAIVTGMDASETMIEQARHKYPEITFIVGDGETFRTADRFDAVFSNAALHWMKRAPLVAESVSRALRPGGRFIAEFGGKGNVGHIAEMVEEVLAKHYSINASGRNPWYFPSIGEYASLLERHDFRVAFAAHFDRPTPLPDGENGLYHWLDICAGTFFQGMSQQLKEEAYLTIKEELKPNLYQNGLWTADYKRIRVAAVKMG
jgi:ubiquinone/menaquinone biosynthesis C-methylase UbiE